MTKAAMIRIAIFFSLVALVGVALAADKKEIEYSRAWCQPKGWEVNHYIKENRKVVAVVDCMGETHAIEIDFAYKYYEAVGQSLRYAVLTGASPGIVLIMGPGDEKYLKRLNEIIHGAFLPIRVWTIKK